METVRLEVGDGLKVYIQSIGGDLRLAGRDGTVFEAQAPVRGDLHVDQDGDRLTISCRSNCLLFMPTSSPVEAEQIGGEVRITGLSNDLLIRTVGGDLSLRRVGRSTFEIVGGDLHARKVSGDLTIDRVGGDAFVERVQGNLRLRNVGGDLRLQGVEGIVEASIGGHASLAFEPQAGTQSSVQAGGDLSCHLPEEASVKVTLRAGGNLHLPERLMFESTDEGTTINLGTGEAALNLFAGGDLWLRSGDVQNDDMVGDVMFDVDAKIAEMEARFSAMGAGMFAFDAERIGERVRKSVARAQRRVARAHHRAAGRTSKPKHRRSFNYGDVDAEQSPLSQEERLAILRMLEKGTITVEQAEDLLKALEGGEA
jgi:hypothetical protein